MITALLTALLLGLYGLISQHHPIIVIGVLLALITCYLWFRVTLERLRIGFAFRHGRHHANYVYCWRDAEDGRYLKIGRSNNPFTRLKTFQTAQPKPIKVVAVIAVHDDNATEDYLHKRFAEIRVRNNNEWFYYTWGLWLYVLLIRNVNLTEQVQEYIETPRGYSTKKRQPV